MKWINGLPYQGYTEPEPFEYPCDEEEIYKPNNNNMTLKTSHEWAKIHGVGLTDFKGENLDVLDPDGWNRKDLDNSYDELINCGEFQSRLAVSTCSFKKKILDIAEIFDKISKEYPNDD